MSGTRPPPTEPAFPPDRPWRVAWTVLSGRGRPRAAFDNLCAGVLALLVAAAIWEERLAGPLAWALAGLCALLLFLIGLVMMRGWSLRAALLSHSGGQLGAVLHFHPILAPLAIFLPAGALAVAIAASPEAAGHPGAGLLTVLAVLAFAALAGVLIVRLRAGTFDDEGVSLRGWLLQRRLLYSQVIRLDWHPAGGTGADRLTLITPSATARFLGQYERNNDVVYRVLDGVIGPRLEAAQAELERDGRAVLGPLWIYPDRFERPADDPPVRVPFALAKSAAINRAGRFVVEIPGRHEPLPLLAPAEYPFVPVALRLTGVLWRAGETVEGDEPESGAGEPPADPGAELAN